MPQPAINKGLIYLVGYMATGKSTIGKQLATALQYNFIDTDLQIEVQEQKTISEIFKHSGEAYFRQKEHECITNTGKLINTIVATGGGTPIYNNNMEYMLQHGTVIWLHTSVANIIDRVQQSPQKRPLIMHLSNEELTKKITAHGIERVPIYSKAHYSFDSHTTNALKIIEFLNL